MSGVICWLFGHREKPVTPFHNSINATAICERCWKYCRFK